MARAGLGVIAAVVAAGCAGPAASAGGPHTDSLAVWGHWLTPDGASVIAIEDCGDGTPCGRVAWVNEKHGGMTCDENNRDAKLRGRAMLGLTLLSGFEERRDRWRSGAIYNPEDGRTYRARLRRLSADALGVSGCLGPVCKELIWKRAPAGQAMGAPSPEAEQVASR